MSETEVFHRRSHGAITWNRERAAPVSDGESLLTIAAHSELEVGLVELTRVGGVLRLESEGLVWALILRHRLHPDRDHLGDLIRD
jgi:hypothetical protein